METAAAQAQGQCRHVQWQSLDVQGMCVTHCLLQRTCQ
jgi:hypothetical protein